MTHITYNCATQIHADPFTGIGGSLALGDSSRAAPAHAHARTQPPSAQHLQPLDNTYIDTTTVRLLSQTRAPQNLSQRMGGPLAQSASTTTTTTPEPESHYLGLDHRGAGVVARDASRLEGGVALRNGSTVQTPTTIMKLQSDGTFLVRCTTHHSSWRCFCTASL